MIHREERRRPPAPPEPAASVDGNARLRGQGAFGISLGRNSLVKRSPALTVMDSLDVCYTTLRVRSHLSPVMCPIPSVFDSGVSRWSTVRAQIASTVGRLVVGMPF